MSYKHPKLECAKALREERNRLNNINFGLRIPTEDNRWTDEELANHKQKLSFRPICKFGDRCIRLQCLYSHSDNRSEICKDFRWCEDVSCSKIHPTQKFLDYLDYTDPELLSEQGFVW